MARYRTRVQQDRMAYRRIMAAEAVDALRRRGLEAEFVETRAEALEAVARLISTGAKVGYGDSATLMESGILDMLYDSVYEIAEWDAAGLDAAEMQKRMADAASAEVFLSGINAMTTDGIIINMDSYGNRTVPIIFGPKTVILVAGINKLTRTFDEAMARAREAAVINLLAWGAKAPCTEVGHCISCGNPGYGCCYTQIIEGSSIKGRMHAILIGEELGY